MKRMKVLFLSLLAISAIQAKVYYVSPDGDNSDGSSWGKAFHSLLDAQQTVSNPCEIWVKQGTYNVVDTTLTMMNGVNVYGGFLGNEANLNARNSDPSLTILNGNKTKRILTAADNLTVETVWDGFTIQNGNSGNAGGVSLLKNATLQNCIIQQNKNAVNSGGGVYMNTNDTDSVKLINCIVRENAVYYNGTATSPAGGGGVYIHDGAAAVIRACTIENNKVDGDSYTGSRMYGGGVFMNDGAIEQSTVSKNKATNIDFETGKLTTVGFINAGGIMVMTPAAGSVRISNCVIEGNVAEVQSGGGIMINPYWTSSVVAAGVTVENTIIANNYSRQQGGGVFCDSQNEGSTAAYNFINCVIANNEANLNPGGGVFINNKAGSTVKFTNSTIVNNRMNTYNYGGAGIYYNNISADITNCIFWGNLNAGTTPLKHHLRTKDVAGNRVIYCAFDQRYVESEITSASDPTDIQGTLSLANENDGASGNLVQFIRPTSFNGIAKDEAQQTEISQALWAIRPTSACVDAGATVRDLKYDLLGTERPYGGKYDIGAYEYNPATGSSIRQTTTGNAPKAYGIKGAIVIDNTDAVTQATVYTLLGANCKTAMLKEGENRINIAQPGIYIVKAGNNTAKVLVK